MMDKREKYATVALVALVAVTAILKMKGHPSAAPSTLGGVDELSSGGGAAEQQQFDAPFQYQTPGIADTPIVLNGGAPFQSSINVNVNPSYLGTLSQNYIPMFGFVGVGNYGTPQPGQLVAPPPQALQFPPVAPSNYSPPPVYTQPSPFRGFSGSGGGGPQLAPLSHFGG